MSEHIVRRARRDEAVAIADVWLRSRRASPIPPAAHTDSEVHDWVAGLLLPSSEVWVATAGSEVVGMMAIDNEWVEQASQVGAGRHAYAGEGFFDCAGSPYAAAAFEDEDSFARSGEIGCTGKAVVTCSDDDRIPFARG